MLQHRLARYLDLIRFDRPVGWLLPLWCSLASLSVATRLSKALTLWPSLHLLIVFTLGTFLMRSAGCCINDVADRQFDRHVKRTAQRPITSGALSVKEALFVGATLALLAFVLVLTTHPLLVALSFAALGIAVAYPFAKRLIAMPQAVLGVAFSFGIPMAFAAVLGRIPPAAWGLMLANFFWVLAYDTQYAMVDRDDDLRIGIRTSAITLGHYDVLAVMLFYAAYLVLWTIFLQVLYRPLGITLLQNPLWLATLALAVGQVLWHYRLIRCRDRAGCFLAFRMNHWLGLTVAMGTVLVAV